MLSHPSLQDLYSADWILLESIAGSKAYGLDTPTSDTDIRGIFILPEDYLFGLHQPQQISDATNDVVFYELGRFMELLGKNNPNIMELLAMPEDCVLKSHPLLGRIQLKDVLSRLCGKTFAGYARAQIKKASGLNKKVFHPMDKKRKSVLDFCYVLTGFGSQPVTEWLLEKEWKQENCGLVKVPHMKNCYGLYHSGDPERFRGIVAGAESNEVSMSSVPKGMGRAALLNFNVEGYSRYCKDYLAYWDWVEKRNEARFEGTVAHGKNYDAKNMMHTFRLLDMAVEIAREQRLLVRRSNREFLLDIRKGLFSFQELVDIAEERLEKIDDLYTNSDLPDEPNLNKLNAVLVGIRKAYYRGEIQ